MTSTTGNEIAPADIDGSLVPLASDRVVFVELDGEGVLYHEERGALHLLNPTATVVWSCFDGSASLDELVVELAEAFGADADLVRTDVMRLAGELGASGMLAGVRGDPLPVDPRRARRKRKD